MKTYLTFRAVLTALGLSVALTWPLGVLDGVLALPSWAGAYADGLWQNVESFFQPESWRPLVMRGSEALLR